MKNRRFLKEKVMAAVLAASVFLGAVHGSALGLEDAGGRIAAMQAEESTELLLQSDGALQQSIWQEDSAYDTGDSDERSEADTGEETNRTGQNDETQDAAENNAESSGTETDSSGAYAEESDVEVRDSVQQEDETAAERKDPEDNTDLTEAENGTEAEDRWKNEPESSAETGTETDTEKNTETDTEEEETEILEELPLIVEEMTEQPLEAAMPDNLEIEDGNPAWAPEVLRSGRASTHKRKVIFQTADGTVTRWAYCLEPLKGNPGEDIYDISQAVILNSGTLNLNLAKTLYYLYGGPAWGKTVGGINLKTIMTDAGCTSSDHYYAMTHYVLGYFYNKGDESLWNVHPAESGVLNSKGVSLVKTLAGYLSSMPNPYAGLSRTSVTSSYDAERNLHVTQSITYQAFQGDTATISLPDGVTLVNETTGTSGTGKVKIDGGDTFHLEAQPTANGSASYTLTCSVMTDFTAFKKTFSGDAQDLGFAYYGSDNTLTFSVDWPTISKAAIRKAASLPELVTGNGMYSLEGARFGVYKDAACTVSAGVFVTDAAGNSTALTLAPGTYYLKEESAPEGYQQDTSVQSVTLAAGAEKTVAFADVPVTQTVGGLLRKQAAGNTDLSLQDAQFEVKFYGSKTPSGNPLRTWIMKTDREGVLALQESQKVGGDAFYRDSSGNICLPLGSLTIQETAAPAGYQLNPAIITILITKEGVKSADQVILQEPLLFEEEPSFIGVKIRKTDAQSGQSAQGDASLAGAVFAVISDNDYTVVKNSDRNTTYKKGDEVMRITTDADGFAQTGIELQAGSYQIREVQAPAGYFINETKTLAFQSMTHGEIADLTAAAVEETIVRGSFSVAKWDLELNEAGRAQGDAVLSGARFSLENRSAGSVLVDADGDGSLECFAPYEEILQFETDEDGRYESPERLLPYGTYALTEIDPPIGYTSEGENLSRLFSIREDGSCVELEDADTATKNRVIRGDISLFKFRDTLSSEEGGDDVEPIAGVEFEIRLKSTGELAYTMVTDEDGFATTADREHYPDGRLPYGLYEITETEYPSEVEPVQPFTVFVGLDANGNEIDHYHYKGIYKNDQPIESAITLVKKDGESDKVIPLAGTRFQILDAEKQVLTFVNHYPHEEELTEFVTDESGTVNLPEKLSAGTYYVRELDAPYGYLCGEDLAFTISESARWDSPLIVEYSDLPAKGKIHLEKSDETTGDPVEGAVFAVFAGENIVTGDGTLYHAAGSLVTTFTTDAAGAAESEELYLGNYYIQEIQAPEGFCLDDSRLEVTLAYADQDTPVVVEAAESSNLPTTLQLFKTSPDQAALEGVRFEIKSMENIPDDTAGSSSDAADAEETDKTETDQSEKEAGTETANAETDKSGKETEQETGTDASEKNVSDNVYTTDASGMIRLQYLRHGIYMVRELETLTGYVLDPTLRFVTVDEQGRIFASDEKGCPLDEDRASSDMETLHFVNGQVFVSKREITSGAELPGAELTIRDGDDVVIDTWISTDTPHPVTGLQAGQTYTLTEEQAPFGYTIAESITFTVETDGSIQTVVMKDAPEEQEQLTEAEPETETETAPETETEETEQQTETPKKSSASETIVPKTGLPSSLLLYVMSALAVLCAAAGVLLARRKRK